MSEVPVNQPLTTADLTRFAQQHVELIDRTRMLGEKVSLLDAAARAGVPYSWAKRFVAGDAEHWDVRRVCKLYLALIGDSSN